MSSLIVFDTCILIDQLRSDRFRQRMLSLDGVVRTSSVVLAELWRGAVTETDFRALGVLEKNRGILTPTEKNWTESGKILAKVRADRGFPPDKLRNLHFDVLIALTAHAYGATLITSNRVDFELIRNHREFVLEIW